MFNLAEYLQYLEYTQMEAALMASTFDFAGIFGSAVRIVQGSTNHHPTVILSIEYQYILHRCRDF